MFDLDETLPVQVTGIVRGDSIHVYNAGLDHTFIIPLAECFGSKPVAIEAKIQQLEKALNDLFSAQRKDRASCPMEYGPWSVGSEP